MLVSKLVSKAGIHGFGYHAWIPFLDTSSANAAEPVRKRLATPVSTYLVTRVVTTLETLKANKYWASGPLGFQKSKVGFQWKPSLFGVETPGACSGLPNRRHHLGSKQAGGKQESKHRKRLFPTSTVEGAVLQLPSAVTFAEPPQRHGLWPCWGILLQHSVTAETGLWLCNRMALSAWLTVGCPDQHRPPTATMSQGFTHNQRACG
jgi:hypothetical protein